MLYITVPNYELTELYLETSYFFSSYVANQKISEFCLGLF